MSERNLIVNTNTFTREETSSFDDHHDHGSHCSSRLVGSTHSPDDDQQEEWESEHEASSTEQGEDDIYQPSSLLHHEYLPGVSHPLFPKEWLLGSNLKRNNKRDFSSLEEHAQHVGLHNRMSKNNDRISKDSSFQRSHSDNDTTLALHSHQKLPILEIDAVSFPGETLPLRLSNIEWVQYLRQKINEARTPKLGMHNEDMSQIQIGVIPHQQAPRRDTTEIESNVVRSTGGNEEEIRYISLEERSPSSRRGNSEIEGNVQNNSNDENDSIIGRIGTFVTITDINEPNDTEEEDDDDAYRSDQNHQGQIIATALCTHRFRILSRIEGDRHGTWRSAFNLYLVQDLNDDTLRLPSYLNKSYLSMSKLHYPAFVYNNVIWPHKLVHECITILSSLKESERYMVQKEFDMEPTRFSFLMATKLPLSFDSRIDLLEMYSTVERLRFIKDVLSSLVQKEKRIECNQCGNNIACMDQAFTVQNAVGVTGNYVNEHGVIHQTITIKDVAERSVVCYGEPTETDSWFPGYSWTIAYCARCYSHIGWMFTQENHNRLENTCSLFWGIAGKSVSVVSKPSSQTIDHNES